MVPLFGGGAAFASDASKKKELPSFGTLRSATADEARTQAQSWLKGIGKTDAATQKAFDAIWAQDRSVLDRVADTIGLGDAAAAKLLAEARDPSAPAPLAVPSILKDAKRGSFFRHNLGLAYAKSLSNRRVFEESLEVLKLVQPEKVVDPSAYLFHRAVAEHALTMKDDANHSILRLLDEAVDTPDRYKMVSLLMAFEMQAWAESDAPGQYSARLGGIARKMDNIERRLELSRGGPHTQKIQKDAVARLDEIIKELENQCNGDCNGGCCPGGSKPGSGQGPRPMPDSRIAKNPGKGVITEKDLRQIAQGWGKLPEKERAEAIQNLTRDMPAKYREVIETYFRKIASESRQ